MSWQLSGVEAHKSAAYLTAISADLGDCDPYAGEAGPVFGDLQSQNGQDEDTEALQGDLASGRCTLEVF